MKGDGNEELYNNIEGGISNMYRFNYFICGKWDYGIYSWIFHSDICDYNIRERKSKKETRITDGKKKS